MSFMDNVSPTMRRSLLIGAILLAALLAVRFFLTAPTAEFATERGVPAAK